MCTVQSVSISTHLDLSSFRAVCPSPNQLAFDGCFGVSLKSFGLHLSPAGVWLRLSWHRGVEKCYRGGSGRLTEGCERRCWPSVLAPSGRWRGPPVEHGMAGVQEGKRLSAECNVARRVDFKRLRLMVLPVLDPGCLSEWRRR